jgi:DNA-binding response OmpR family regulator
MARILLIEDSEEVRRLLARALRHAGHEVAVASGGVEGLRLFRVAPADIVITDIFMPEQDGLETIRDLRREGRPFRMIAMSGGGTAGQMEVLKTARHMGADRVLAKPFRIAELTALIEELMENSSSPN